MPRCTHCGSDSPEGSRFCISCGQAINGKSPQSATRRGAAPSSADLARADRLLTEAFGLSDEGRLTDAVRVALQAVTINPDSTTAHSLLGTLYERLGNREAAIREYQTVLSLSPGSTADRQRLNELLGLPTTTETPQAAVRRPVTERRPDLLYVGGGGAVILLVIIAIIVLINRTGQNEPEKETPTTPPQVRMTTSQPVVIANPTPAPVPGLPSAAPPAGTPTTPLPDFSRVTVDPNAVNQVAINQTPPLNPQLGPQTGVSREPQPLILPYPGYRPAGQTPASTFLPGGGIVLNTPIKIKLPSSTGRTGVLRAVLPTATSAHRLALSGRLSEASEVYEAVLARQPDAAPKMRVELAMVYSKLHEPAKAAKQYMRALEQYQEQLNSGASGDDANEAEHGMATCRAALRALGVDSASTTE